MSRGSLQGAIGANTRSKVVVIGRNEPLIGYRPREPQSVGNTSTVSQDMTSAIARFGPCQFSKDYISNSLPATYSSPYPSNIRVILSISDGINFVTNPNFNSFIDSVPAGTILTYQHEPERPTFTWTGAQYVAQLNDFRARIRARRGNQIPVWLISSGYAYRAGNKGTDGSFTLGLNVDGYGLDTYRSGEANTNGVGYKSGGAPIRLRNRPEFITWFSKIPTGVNWAVTEFGIGWAEKFWTPTTVGTPSTMNVDRIADLNDCIQDVRDLGGLGMLYFLSSEGPDGQPWRPLDQGFADNYTALPRATTNPLLAT